MSLVSAAVKKGKSLANAGVVSLSSVVAGAGTFYGVRGALEEVGASREAGKPLWSFSTALAVGGRIWDEFDEGPIRYLARQCTRSLPMKITSEKQLWTLIGNPKICKYRVGTSDILATMSGAWLLSLVVGVGGPLALDKSGVTEDDELDVGDAPSLWTKYQPLCYFSKERLFEQYAVANDGNLYLKDALKAGFFKLEGSRIVGPLAVASGTGRIEGGSLNSLFATREEVASWASEAIAAVSRDPQWKSAVPKSLTVDHMLTLLTQEAQPAGKNQYSCTHVNSAGFCGLFQFQVGAWKDAQGVFPWLPNFEDGWRDGRANTYAAVAYAVRLSGYAKNAWRIVTQGKSWNGFHVPSLSRYAGRPFEPSSEFLQLAHNQFYAKPFQLVIGRLTPTAMVKGMSRESKVARGHAFTVFSQYGAVHNA